MARAGQPLASLAPDGDAQQPHGTRRADQITTADGRAQWNEATTAVGYACSSDPRVHFGLGPNTLVKEMQITWPSRTIQRLANISADQILTIEEPKS